MIGKIKILFTPPGDKKLLHQRTGWINLSLSYVKETATSYLVDSATAIIILRENKRIDTLRFYEKIKGGTFGFPKKVCQKL